MNAKENRMRSILGFDPKLDSGTQAPVFAPISLTSRSSRFSRTYSLVPGP